MLCHSYVLTDSVNRVLNQYMCEGLWHSLNCIPPGPFKLTVDTLCVSVWQEDSLCVHSILPIVLWLDTTPLTPPLSRFLSWMSPIQCPSLIFLITLKLFLLFLMPLRSVFSLVARSVFFCLSICSTSLPFPIAYLSIYRSTYLCTYLSTYLPIHPQSFQHW